MSHVGPTPPNAAPPEPVPEARPATLLPEGVDRRLHPATILVDIVRRIAGLAYLIAIALFLRFAGGGGGSRIDFIIGGLALLGVIGAVLRYISLRYGFEGHQFVIRSGLLFRQARTIPLDRIQNLSLKRNVLHRLLGIVDVQLETAVAGGAEATLSAISERAAAALRREVAARRGVVDIETVAAPPAATELWRAAWWDLFLLGATENRAGWIVGGAVGVYFTFEDVLRKALADWAARVPEFLEAEHISPVLLIGAATLLLVGIGWVLSITFALINYYDFRLRLSEDRIGRQYGLFTSFESLIRRNRVQALRITSPWLRRLIGRATIYAETAGSFGDSQRQRGSVPLCPLAPVERLSALCRVAFPDFQYDEVAWRAVSRRTIRRGFVRYSIVPSLVLAGVAWSQGGGVWWILLPACWVVATWLAFARFRAMGYAEAGPYILSRYGIFTRQIWILPRSKVQHVVSQANPFQRRQRLATLAIATAGAAGHVPIIDLPADTAAEMQVGLARDAAAAGAWLPDGV